MLNLAPKVPERTTTSVRLSTEALAALKSLVKHFNAEREDGASRYSQSDILEAVILDASGKINKGKK